MGIKVFLVFVFVFHESGKHPDDICVCLAALGPRPIMTVNPKLAGIYTIAWD